MSQSGALIVGGPDEVVEKIRFYDEALGGISRLTFQMDLAALPHTTLMRAIELLGTRRRSGRRVWHSRSLKMSSREGSAAPTPSR
jgi:hypothetical protein